MKVVVTGGAGFIGGNLCRTLSARAEVDEIVVLDDLSSGLRSNLVDTRAKLIEGSIADSTLLADVFAGAHAVVHLAARPSVPKSLLDPMATHEANATGTLRVLEAVRAAGAYAIVASSSSVYGSTPDLPKSENSPVRPMSPYAVSKLATEGYALAYQASFGVPVLAFRFFNVYGPLQRAGHAYAAVVPAFVDAALDERPVTIFGDGLQTRDFTYVGTVTEALAQAVVQRRTSAGPVNLAFGTRHSLLDLVAALRETLQRDVAIVHEEARPADVRDSQAATEQLRRLFPDVQPVLLVEGLARTVEWHRSARAAA